MTAATSGLKLLGSTFDRLVIAPSGAIRPEDQRDARLVTWLALVTSISVSIRLLYGLEAAFLGGFLAMVVAYFLSRTRYRQVAGLIIVVLLAVPTFVNLLTLTPTNPEIREWVTTRAVWLALPMVLASIFFSWRGTAFYGVALTGALALIPVVHPELTYSSLAGTLGLTGTLTLLLSIAVNHRDLVERDRQVQLLKANAALKESEATLEKRVVERTQQLDEARRVAELANRVKSQFLASVSHELRTPLNSIINFTKFVHKGVVGPVNDEQVDVLSKVVASAEHLLNLINDVLDISKIEAGALQLFVEDEIDLQPEVDSVAAIARSLLVDKPVELQVDLPPALPHLRGDRQRLRQIMLNLVSNACKFTDEGQITIRAHQQADDLVVEVRDTGPGIPAADQEAIFESFRQTESGLRKGAGTGLGLAISRRLAEAHGGGLSVESAPGHGSTFLLRIPLHAEGLALTLEPGT